MTPQFSAQNPSPPQPGNARSRMPFSLLRVAVLLFFGYTGICAVLAWKSVKANPEKLTETPQRWHIPYEDVTFQSADGTPLSGWYVPVKSHPKGVIILCHGVDGNRISMLPVAHMLHQHGYAALLFDFRARGQSGGTRCTLGYREVDDLLAAVQAVRARPDAKKLPMGVLGESMGGAVALIGTARCPDIRAVVAESPFASLDHAVANHFHSIIGIGGPFLGVPTRWIGEKLIGAHCEDIAPVHEIDRIAPRPVFLIQDEADTLCPKEETKELMAAAKKPKSLWTVRYAVHVNAKWVESGEYERRVTTFFDRNLHASSH